MAWFLGVFLFPGSASAHNTASDWWQFANLTQRVSQIPIFNSISNKSKTVEKPTESEVFLVATLTLRLRPPFLLPVINFWLAASANSTAPTLKGT